jgi:ATP-dependent protease HslVU (ClpYQ) peptidase subunit
MTTVATRGDGILVADSQCTWGDSVKLRVAKLHRLKDGSVAGGCGHVSEILAAVKWLDGSRKGKAPKMRNCDVLIARPDGTTVTLCPDGIFSEVKGPMAIGSGMQAAMAAMVYFGASAEEAVMAAAEVDPNTSAPVDVMRVEPRAKRRKK